MISYYLGNIIHYVEWLAFASSFFCYSTAHPKPMRLFSWVLGAIVVAEFFASGMAFRLHFNGIVYNILDFIWFPGYMYFFRSVIQFHKFKRTIGYLIAFFYLFAFVNFFWFQNDHRWLAHRTFVVGSLGVVACATLALIEIGNEKKQRIIKHDPIFWISVAMLLYFFPSAIVIEGFDYFEFKAQPISNAYGQAVRYSQKILNVIHYSLLSYAFVCRSIFPPDTTYLENKKLQEKVAKNRNLFSK